MTRRHLLQSTLAFAGAPAPAADPWFDKPMRWAQLVFVEDDPGNYDMQLWVDYFRRTHADGACLAGGGYMAYYPTKVPFHHKSRWMKDGMDPFGDLVAACRKLNMAVIARTDPHATYQDAYEAHPDWIHVDEQGKKRRHWANPELWVTCALGPYNFEFMTDVTREIVQQYKVDGVFSNRWSGHGVCYCEHCQGNFKKASGFEIPRTRDPKNEPWRAYVMWRQQRLFELWRLWDSEIRKINPGACFIANSGGGALSTLDMKTVGELSPILFADRQARHGLLPPWGNGKNAKEYRSTLGNKPVGGIFSVGVEEAYRWKDSVQSPDEIAVWVADGIAHGLRPWYAKFNGKIIDKRWLDPVEKIYTWHWRNERYLRNEQSLAEVGLVYSQQSAWFYGGEQAQKKLEDHTLGWYQALVESRIPFEMVHDRMLDKLPYRTLILPNIAALSNAQCEQLRSFVNNGGSLIATYETSLYEEWGQPRKDFGLGDLFGCSYGGRIDARMQNSYLALDGPHPLLKGLNDTPRIVNTVGRVIVKPAGSSQSPLKLVASYPDLPMEDVFPRTKTSDEPQVYIRTVGKGRVIYFPGDLDRTYWEVLQRDHLSLLANAVDHAHRGRQPVEVTGPGMIDIAVWKQKSSLTVHLVNLTNPMTMRGTFREIIPVGKQQILLRVPPGRTAKAAKLLTKGIALPYRMVDGMLAAEVPGIDLHEVVAVDLT